MQHTIADRAVFLGVDELETLDAPTAWSPPPCLTDLPTGHAIHVPAFGWTFGKICQAGQDIFNTLPLPTLHGTV